MRPPSVAADSTKIWRRSGGSGQDEFIAILSAKGTPPAFGNFLISLSGTGSFSRILDVGCGIGRLFAATSTLARMVVGLDYSAPLLEVAQRHANNLANVLTVRHDMRSVADIFGPDSFDLILRAYTSLGYFSFETEVSILEGLRRVGMPNCRVVIDTFNQNWIQTTASIERRTAIEGFGFEERYRWDQSLGLIESRWTYRRADREEFIDFTLEGYTLAKVDKLLSLAGWKRTRLYGDYDPDARLDADDGAERLIVVAEPA